MSLTFAFDIYGTLIDTTDVSKQLQSYIGDLASDFSNQWREKQLEYSFRKGLMQRYQDFSVCTKEALDYTDAFFSCSLSTVQKQSLLERYKVLPAFDDVKDSLEALQKEQVQIYAFSNGTASAVHDLLSHAEISSFFIDVISTDEVHSFKPSPAVYHHFLKRSQSLAKNTWLISSNSFDVLGAKSAGLNSAWIQRHSNSLIDPWEIGPDATFTNLRQLSNLL